MKKRFIPKIIGLLVIYFAVFVLISFAQFAPRDNFSKQAGALRISGNFEREADGETPKPADGTDEYFVKDGVSASFGGLEFHLSGNADSGLAYTGPDGKARAAYPETMTLSKDGARFRLSGGNELLFYTGGDSGENELVISALITGDVEEILLPFKLYNDAKIKRNELGGFSVNYDNAFYGFGMGQVDEKDRIIFLSKAAPSVSYGAILSDDLLNFNNFVVLGSMDAPLYNEQLTRWRDVAFAGWERRINSGSFDEYLATAFLAESARRGVLRRSLSIIPAVFRRSNTRTFLSAPFLGGLRASLNGFTEFERERMAQITSYTQTDPSAFLTEANVFKYLSERGNYELFDTGIAYVNELNTSAVTLDMCAGIFEGYIAWMEKRGDDENPFERLIARARPVVSAHLKKDANGLRVFVVETDVDVEYNLRLGSAIASYGEAADNSGWLAIGRSLVLSALSFSGEDASISARLDLQADGEFTTSASAGTLTAARIYAGLELSGFYPHTADLDAISGSGYLWTVSPAVTASFNGNVLDIGVAFKPGDTHYIYIFNVRPFSKIQLRNIDWRSDAQFEQYDAPGWFYSSSANVLMLKIAQQVDVEHIRVFF
ncbi:MAG: hypothetical protein LBC27_02345 [Spirochaetaceae bacterium]|jgi:hypothetical protein|nr:hypothetical protein [Spirochaetaceae bacterium]